MSITAMASCWGPEFPVNNRRMSKTVIRLVALAIADMVSDGHNNEFFMSADNLAKKVGLHRVTVSNVLSHLVQTRVLVIRHRARYKPTCYRWVWLNIAHGYTEDEPYGYTVCSPRATQTQVNPRKRTETIAAEPLVSQEEEDMDFGSDPDKPAKPEGKSPAPSRVVIRHFEAAWVSVLQHESQYSMHKVVDSVAFAKYLNTTFLGPGAKTKMTVEQVTQLIDGFMSDLRYGGFSLKDNQPVWMAFTRRWQNFIPDDGVSTTNVNGVNGDDGYYHLTDRR